SARSACSGTSTLPPARRRSCSAATTRTSRSTAWTSTSCRSGCDRTRRPRSSPRSGWITSSSSARFKSSETVAAGVSSFHRLATCGVSIVPSAIRSAWWLLQTAILLPSGKNATLPSPREKLDQDSCAQSPTGFRLRTSHKTTPPAAAAASVWPFGLKATPVTPPNQGRSSLGGVRLLAAALQNDGTALSRLPQATIVPSGLTLTLDGSDVCFGHSIRVVDAPLAASQSRILRSRPPETTTLPSGPTATHVTSP